MTAARSAKERAKLPVRARKEKFWLSSFSEILCRVDNMKASILSSEYKTLWRLQQRPNKTAKSLLFGLQLKGLYRTTAAGIRPLIIQGQNWCKTGTHYYYIDIQYKARGGHCGQILSDYVQKLHDVDFSTEMKELKVANELQFSTESIWYLSTFPHTGGPPLILVLLVRILQLLVEFVIGKFVLVEFSLLN